MPVTAGPGPRTWPGWEGAPGCCARHGGGDGWHVTAAARHRHPMGLLPGEPSRSFPGEVRQTSLPDTPWEKRHLW